MPAERLFAGTTPFLSGGSWRQGETAAAVRDPFTGKVLAEVSQAGRAAADAAVQSTADAAATMGALPSHARYHLLQKIAGSLYERREEFARLMTAEAGKPITDAKREVNRAIQTFRVAAEEARRIPVTSSPRLDAGNRFASGNSSSVPDWSGARITPFNFPLNLVAHKVAPALAAGNSILIKPAPTPLTALLLGKWR